MRISQALFPRTVASRSPSPPILSRSVFRCFSIACLSIDGGRLGYLVPLDLGVEADYVVRFKKVSLCTSHRASAAAPHNKSSSCSSSKLPFSLAHTVRWVRTHQWLRQPTSGYLLDCWSTAASVAFWLMTMSFFKIFADFNLVPHS